MDSTQNFDLIGSWLDVCSPEDRNHHDCHSELKLATSPVPRRLLDIAAGNSGHEIRFSLSHSDRRPLPYLTLSHSWGPKPDLLSMPLLRQQNIEDSALEIPFQSLPRLFRHAINFTRRFGFRYIWIDAFCVVQDDEEDFLKESAVMGEIYQHAALNLSAATAVNSHSPVMGKRNVCLVKPYQTKVDWSSVPGESEISNSQSHFILDKDFLSENVQKTLINRRAWILQEQMLAPRVLHFGKHQLFWKCRGSQFCETFPFGIPDLPISTLEDRLGTLSAKLIEPKDVLRWFHIAERYSDCGITRLGDKLIAISGFAHVFHARILKRQHTYVSGIWSGELIPSLLWHSLDGRQWNEEPCKRAAEYMAPSWSWASFCGKVRFTVDIEHSQAYLDKRSKEADTVVELLDYSVDLLDPRYPYGPVTNGFLKLSGLLRPASDFYWIPYVTSEKANERNYNARQAVFDLSISITTFIDCIFDDVRDYDLRKQSNLIPGSYKVNDAFFLPILMRSTTQWSFSTDENEKLPTVEGILVAPVRDDPVGDNHDVYTRIGYFKSKIGGDNAKRLIEIFWGGRSAEFILQ